jgi:prepilin-type N-terminal cleavage/methylation domain-containing protein
MSRAQRPLRGFTLIELLVVITIMGMLMAMIFPAFEMVRENMNKTKCQANLGSLAKAMLTIEATKQGFPGLVEPGPTSRENPNGVRMTWCTVMLDSIDQKPLYASWFGTSSKDAGAIKYQVAQVSTFICPSDPPQGSLQPLSYVVNAGTVNDGNVTPVQVKTVNGVFFNRYPIYPPSQRIPSLPARVSKSTLKHGANYVIMMTENIQAHQWADKRMDLHTPQPYDSGGKGAVEAQQFTGFVRDGTRDAPVLRINQGTGPEDRFDKYDQAPNRQWSRPSSRHTEGVYVAFCSGVARWMADSVEPHILEVLTCSDPIAAAKLPGSTLSKLARDYTPRDGDF